METTNKLVDAGIDYLRVTSCDERAKGRLLDFYRAVRNRDEKLGYEDKVGGAFGFIGRKVRHALYGDKREWRMLQVSGYEAKSTIKLGINGTQASRIDLQLTFHIGNGQVEQTIREAYSAACDATGRRSRPVKVNLIESRHRAQTVYIGSRASDVFFRIYDKYEESGKEEYKDCVRYELELKGRLAKALWARIVAFQINLEQMLEMMLQMLSERGVEVPCDGLDRQDIMQLKRQPTTIENTVGWLAQQVAPTITKLSQSHGWIFAFSVLFQQALTDVDKSRIMKSLAVVWGS